MQNTGIPSYTTFYSRARLITVTIQKHSQGEESASLKFLPGDLLRTKDVTFLQLEKGQNGGRFSQLQKWWVGTSSLPASGRPVQKAAAPEVP